MVLSGFMPCKAKVGTEMVHTLHENSPVEKELSIVPKARHGEAFRMDLVKYESVVTEFIGRFVKCLSS